MSVRSVSTFNSGEMVLDGIVGGVCIAKRKQPSVCRQRGKAKARDVAVHRLFHIGALDELTVNTSRLCRSGIIRRSFLSAGIPIRHLLAIEQTRKVVCQEKSSVVRVVVARRSAGNMSRWMW